MSADTTHLDLQEVLNHFSAKTAVDLVLYDTFPDDGGQTDEPVVDRTWELAFETPDGVTIEIDSNPSLNSPNQTNVSVFGPEIELDRSIKTYKRIVALANRRDLGVSLHNSGVIWARADIPEGNADSEEDAASVVEALTEAAETATASLTSRLCVSERDELHQVDNALASIRDGMEELYDE